MSDVPRLRSINADALQGLEDEVATVLAQQQLGASLQNITEEDVGRLSAEAVLSQYEVASKAIEGMGEDMKVSIKGLEAAMHEADEAMKAVTELAATIREKGKLHQVRVEQATMMARDIVNACAEFHKKITGGAAEE